MTLHGNLHVPALGVLLAVAIAFALLLVGIAWVNRRWRKTGPPPTDLPSNQMPAGRAESSNKKDLP